MHTRQETTASSEPTAPSQPLNDFRTASKTIRNTRRLLKATEHKWNEPRIYVNGPDCLKVRVAKPSIDRALLFFDQLIRTAEASGVSVVATEEDTIFTVGGVPINVFLIEKIERKEAKHEKYSWRTYEYHPTNVLTFCISEWARQPFQKNWSDGKAKIEVKIPKIVTGLLEAAEILREDRKRREEEQRIMDEENRLWREECLREAKDKRHFEELQESVATWLQHGQILAYLEACEKELRRRSNGQLTDEAKAWLEWAHRKIETSNPVVAQVEGILGSGDKVERVSK